MKLGIFVGSFNPVHEGHIKVANYLLENNYVDRVLILPTPNYWEKQDLIPVRHRYKMLKYFETDKIIIDNKHNNYPFTYQVLRSLKKDYQDELYLIIGSDNMPRLHEWRNIDEILNNKIIVLNRNNLDIDKYLDRFDRSKFVIVSDFPFIDVSSTEIRNGNFKNIDPRVVDYIKKHQLYRGNNNGENKN